MDVLVGDLAKGISKIDEGESNWEWVSRGIVKNGLDSKNVFHTAIDALEKTLLEGCVYDVVGSYVSFKSNCNDLVE